MTASDTATWSALAQLYLPLAGLIGLAFWTGVLHQKVMGLEKECSGDGQRGERIVRLETKMDGVINQIGGLDGRLLELTKAIASAQPPPYAPRPIRGAGE